MINIINNIFIFFIILFRYLIFFKFSRETSKLKTLRNSQKIICDAALILAYGISSYFFEKVSLYYLPVIFELILYFIYLRIIYKNSLTEDIILTFTYYITFYSFDYMVYLSIMQIDKYIKLPWLITEYGPGILSIAIIYFFITKIALRFMNFKEYSLKIKEFYLLLFFCLVSLISLSIFYNSAFSVTVGLVCWVATVALTYDFRLIEEKDKQREFVIERNHLLEEQDKLLKTSIDEKNKSFQKSKEAESEIRRIHHDLNHHFNYLLSCEGLPKEAEDYINKLKGQNNVVEKFFDTGNALVDIILEELKSKAQAAGIKLEVIGGFDEPLGIEPADLSVILGNLTNNALKGANKVRDNYKKIIVNFYQGPNEDNGRMEFYLKVQNNADTNSLNIKDGKLETTKEDKSSHGIGLKSVKKIVQSYGGTMNIDIKPERFIVELHIPFKK